MASVRIRWRGVARIAAIVLIGLLALRLLPGLLRAPEPPPLAADVGLPQAKPVTEAPRRRHPRHPATRPVRDAPAAVAVIGVHHEHRLKKTVEARPKPTAEPAAPVPESTPPPIPEYVPPAAPEPVPEPLPEPAPAPSSTPGDGSEEFAPH